MHSGVFAVSPEAAGELLLQLLDGGLVGLQLREVRDIDEDAFRQDVVKARFYGEMLVPAQGQYLQQTKLGGRESPDLQVLRGAFTGDLRQRGNQRRFPERAGQQQRGQRQPGGLPGVFAQTGLAQTG